MAKIVFKAEVRLPKQIVLPLIVASEAASPRVLFVKEREIEVAEPIAQHLEERHPNWLEAKPSGDSDPIFGRNAKTGKLEQTGTASTGSQANEPDPNANASDAAPPTPATQGDGQPPVDPAVDQADAAPADEGQPLGDAKLKKLNIAQLEAYAAEWGIDLGDAKKHDDIVDVIIKSLADEGAEANSDS